MLEFSLALKTQIYQTFFIVSVIHLCYIYLFVAEGDGEPSVVAVDDLYGVVIRAADVHSVRTARDHLQHLAPLAVVSLST